MRKDLPQKYELDLSRGILKANDDADHARLMQALQAMQQLQQAQPQAPAPIAAPVQADDPTALKLAELLEKFLLLKKVTQATAIAYKNCIEEISKFLKNPAITRITASDVTRYQEFLAEKGNGVRTIDNKISIVRAVFNFAVKQGYTRNGNPAQNRALLHLHRIYGARDDAAGNGCRMDSGATGLSEFLYFHYDSNNSHIAFNSVYESG